MATNTSTTLISNSFAQVAWVVRDIKVAEKFFIETIGIPRFIKMEHLRTQDIEGTCYREPGDYEYHLYLAYSGEP